MAKIIAALVLMLLFVLPAGAQESEEEWVRYTDFLDVVRFEYPASWEIDDPRPFYRSRSYSETQISGAEHQGIQVLVERFDLTRWSNDFNLPFNTDFETLIAEAIRWRNPDYEVLELGNRKFIRYTQILENSTFSFLVTFLDTGIFGTVFAFAPPESIDEINEIAARIATSLEYTGDIPVDISCARLTRIYGLSVSGGDVNIAISQDWEVSVEDFSFRDSVKGIDLQKPSLIGFWDFNRECLGVPDVTVSFIVDEESPFASVMEAEQNLIEDLTENGNFISVEHLTFNDNAVAIINSGIGEIVFNQYYIGNLDNGYQFTLVFQTIPGQFERWQEIAIAMIESIQFEPSD